MKEIYSITKITARQAVEIKARYLSRLCLILLCLFVGNLSVTATNFIYTNAVSTDWQEPGNWTPSYPGTTVGAGHTIEINGSGLVLSIDEALSIGCDLTFNASVSLGVGGTYNQTAGTVTLSNNSSFFGGITSLNSGAVLNVEAGSNLRYNSSVVAVLDGDLVVNGSITPNGTQTANVSINGNVSGTGNIRLDTNNSVSNFNGTVSPGTNGGSDEGCIFLIVNNWSSGAVTNLTVDGTNACTTHDRMNGINTIDGVIGGTLNFTVNYTPTSGDKVTIWNGTNSNIGTYDQVNAPPGWAIAYDSPVMGAIEMQYTQISCDMVINSVTTTDEACAGANDGTVSINAACSTCAGIQYSIDGGATFQSSNVFTGVSSGTVNAVAQDTGGGNICEATDNTQTVGAGSPDTSDPTITCPSDINQGTDTNSCDAVVTWMTPVVSDDCGTATITGNTHNSGDTFPLGTTTVEYTVADAAGNTATCSFDVIITDDETPTYSACPLGISTTTDAGTCTATVTWTAPTAADNCGLASDNSTHNSGASFPAGTTTVTYTATDNAGLTGTCSFTVTVTDEEAPTANCPSDITQNTSANSCDAVVTWPTIVVMDNCTGGTVNGSTHKPGDTFSVGTTTVEYTLADAAGNIATCSFDVIIEDKTPPTLSCPTAQTVAADENCEGIITDVAALANANDNCSNNLTITQDLPLGTSFTNMTTLTVTATDDDNNSSTCTVDFTATDQTAPTFNCPDNATFQAQEGVCGAFGYLFNPSVDDNCDLEPDLTATCATAFLFSWQNAHFGSFPVGDNEIVFTATDEAGNSSSCITLITIEDSTPPVLQGCPENPITAVSPPDECGTEVQFGLIYPTDACGESMTLTSTHLSGDFFDVGTTEVTFTATDASGNEGFCVFDVVVRDETNPVVTCQDATVSLDNMGNASVTVAELVTEVSDNCPITLADVTPDDDAFDCADVGSLVTVTATATDASDNTGTCTSTVTVLDEIAPIAFCQDLNVSLGTDGTATVTAAMVDNGSYDNCPNFTLALTAGKTSYDCDDHGQDFTLTLTITDASMATATCTATISVSDDQVPVITCPSDMVVATDQDVCSAVVNYAMPTVVDNCSTTVQQTEGEASGSVFMLGTTTNTYSVSDAAGNTTTCSFTVTVNDTQAPNAVCQDASVQLDTNGAASISVADINNGSNDNCTAVPALALDITSFACSDLGTNTVTLTVTDDAGNNQTCTATVTVEDNIDPVFTDCPTDITQGNDMNSCDAAVTWTPPTASDNCSETVNSTHNPGDTFPVGTTTVGYTVTDAAGNTATCSFDVTINDTQSPTVSCPADIAKDNDPGDCSAVVTWPEPTYGDNCPGESISSDIASGATFNVGTTVVTYTVTDAANNPATCSFNVVVSDTETPVISACPTDITVDNDKDDCDADAMWTAPTATDNCSFTMTSTANPGDNFLVGTTIVTYTATDPAGLTATCSFDVTVNDTEDPTITCPMDIAQGTDDTSCDAVVTWSAPIFDDNCTGASIMSDHDSGDTFPVGTTTVNYTVTDAAGNTATCSFDVVISDDDDPAFAGCPTDITVSNTTDECGAAVMWTAPTESDNCSATVMHSHDPGDFFAVGTTTVTYTATDPAGNTAVCSFDVTVNDTQNPTIMCPSDIAQNNDPSVCGATVTWTAPTFNDNCTGASLNSDYDPGDSFPVGTTTVNYTVTDASGNTASCSFDVVITDAEAPVISGCPTDIIVDNDPDDCGADVMFTAPTATDNCSFTMTSTANPGDNFPIGTTAVTYTATDPAGLSTTCSFNVTVNDTQDPSITCPSDVALGTDDDACSAVVVWMTPTFGDNCPGESAVSDYNSGDTFPVGTTTVNYTVTDAAGNTATCSFDVVISDDQNPEFMGCPSNITDVNTEDECGAAVTWTAPTESDNCSATVMSSHDPGDFFDVGTTTVTYTATDPAGNTGVCTFDVTINDTEDPTITCPSDIVQGMDDGECDAVVTWADPTFDDNCTGSSIMSDYNSGATFGLGTTTVNYTVTDASGNTASCSFDVIISDNELPDAVCKDITIELDENGMVSITDDQLDGGSTDNCGIDTVVAAQTDFDCTDAGVNAITLTVTDVNGNLNTCSANVRVEDNIAPTVTACPTDIEAMPLPNVCSGSASWTIPTFMDNCNNVSVTVDTEGVPISTNSGLAFGAFPGGTTTITYTGTDPSGNPTVCTFSVTVTDDIAPTVTDCPSDINDTTDSGDCEAQVFWTPPTVIDNCPGTTVVSSADPGDIFPVGTTNVGYTITDAAGNIASCDFSVTITDGEKPQITCPTGPVAATGDGNCGYTIPDLAAVSSATDNCTAAPAITQSLTAGTSITSTASVTLTATDDAGNASTCIVDVEVPMMLTASASATDASCPASTDGTLTLSVTGGTMPYSYAWSNDATTADLAAVAAGTYHVTVTDAAGCTANASATVNGTDTSNPNAVCQNIVVALDNDGVAMITGDQLGSSSTDDCGIASYSVMPNSFDCTSLGNNSVVVTVTDESGNTDNCSAVVTVENPLAGTPDFCGNNYVVALDEDGNTFFNSTVIGTVTDNCGDVEVYVDGIPLDCEDVGQTSVVEVAYINGNGVGECNVTVDVIDNLSPTADCKQVVMISLDASGNAVITPDLVDNGSADNCLMNPTLSVAPSVFDCDNIGNNVVTLTVSDGVNPDVTCTSIVQIGDNIVLEPSICGGTFDVFLDSEGEVTWDENAEGPYADNCGNLMIFPTTNTDFDCSHVGTPQTVSVGYFDGKNFDICSLTVNVYDTEAPTALCRPTILNLDGTGNITLNPTLIDDGSSDNCNLVSFTALPNQFDCTQAGTSVEVELTVTDAQGLTATCTTEVEIVDNEVTEPFYCGDTFTLALDNTGNAVFDIFALPPVMDNCTGPLFVYGDGFANPTFTCDDLGSNVVSLNYSDFIKVTSCDVTIEVTDPLGACSAIPNIGSDTGTTTADFDGSDDSAAVTTTDVSSEAEQIRLSHLAAYPNPFTVSTTIEYHLSRAAETEITVWDAMGRRVDVLLKGQAESGIHQLQWTPDYLPAGLYRIRVQVENEPVQVIKLSLIR